LGTIVTLPNPQLLEIALLAGCEWIFVDCEHGAITTSGLGCLLTGVPRDVPVLVRLPANDEVYVKQALDSGAAGIICPSVEDAATAARLVSWAKYPPAGTRSVGIGRAHGYGLGLASYMEQANGLTSVVVQIESIAGVRALDDILEVSGLGGVFIGPYDLSASMGLVGQPTAPAVRKTIHDIVERCRARAVPVGQFFGGAQAFGADEISGRLDFAALGLDTTLLAQSLELQLCTARSVS
jgi:2-dehydro-3-deoxyglucarate aldolase/4-hydroxy-2-oxoheptanedioate aldolase